MALANWSTGRSLRPILRASSSFVTRGSTTRSHALTSSAPVGSAYRCMTNAGPGAAATAAITAAAAAAGFVEVAVAATKTPDIAHTRDAAAPTRPASTTDWRPRRAQSACITVIIGCCEAAASLASQQRLHRFSRWRVMVCWNERERLKQVSKKQSTAPLHAKLSVATGRSVYGIVTSGWTTPFCWCITCVYVR